ncbi:nicotinamide riboside transporter PnuC [Sphingobacterium sp. UT-1RO-CII-1]|uniref:nicotinamide riboside transporter PnuC n=1 Tax=Sphingobacterium sp. UT-1RO-CII-1 TaxID=2995225 RepID=UPI00227C28E1|nr:nicotinamide riboside transporter PnuC [Sphingobacterium sp. UT-1RO-CII-1]MCY4781255.1 nicotinamide riboside transporter PnuC [Sphingobacterium sp. UT-1RO-CII-1]
MSISDIFQQVLSALEDSSWSERVAVIFSVTQVLLSKNNKSSNYIFGILSISLTISVLYGVKLYAEILLNMYYLIMSFYGLWYWRHKTDRAPVQITKATRAEWGVVSLIVLLGYGILFFVLTKFTDSDVPMLDAIVSSTAWAGMWLMAKRKIENWILLNISNAIAIPLMFYKGLFLFGFLTIFLFIIAVLAYFQWKRLLKKQESRYVI